MKRKSWQKLLDPSVTAGCVAVSVGPGVGKTAVMLGWARRMGQGRTMIFVAHPRRNRP
jgi:hypothetical protein